MRALPRRALTLYGVQEKLVSDLKHEIRVLQEENRELRRAVTLPVVVPTSPASSSSSGYSSSSSSSAAGCQAGSVWHDITLPVAAAAAPALMPPSSAPGRTESKRVRPTALPLLSPSLASPGAAVPVGARRPSPITLVEPSPVKAAPRAPPPPLPSVAMSPAILAAMLRSGGTLGPPAHMDPILPANSSAGGSTTLTEPRLRRTRTADGGVRAPAVVGAATAGLSKDVFFDPEKRAEALRRLQEARVVAPLRGAFGKDTVVERGRQAMAATRHHMYKKS